MGEGFVPPPLLSFPLTRMGEGLFLSVMTRNRHRCGSHHLFKGSYPIAAVRNVAREKLEQGQLALGVGIRMSRTVEIAKAMAVAGFDWLFLDMEHGVMSLEACAQIATAALDAGIAPIARVPNGEYAIATRALDNGALGIVMPHVDTAANLTVVMLETPTAIENAEEIAAVPGVDVLLIGTNDLCAEMGIPGDFGNEQVAEAYRKMIA